MEYKDRMALAAKLLKLPAEEIAEYSVVFEEENALYVSVPVKGGASMLIADDGTVLYANSSVSLDDHIREFKNGRRTPKEAFK